MPVPGSTLSSWTHPCHPRKRRRASSWCPRPSGRRHGPLAARALGPLPQCSRLRGGKGRRPLLNPPQCDRHLPRRLDRSLSKHPSRWPARVFPPSCRSSIPEVDRWRPALRPLSPHPDPAGHPTGANASHDPQVAFERVGGRHFRTRSPGRPRPRARPATPGEGEPATVPLLCGLWPRDGQRPGPELLLRLWPEALRRLRARLPV